MSDWRLPTPHEVLYFLLVLASGALTVGLFPDGSVKNKLCALAALVFGGSGISAAKSFQSARVKEILNNHDENVRSALARTKNPAAAFLPFALIGALMFSACTPGALALGNCELGQLPKTLQSVAVAVTAALSNNTGDLEQVGLGLAPGQFSCVVQAVVSSFKKNVPSRSEMDPKVMDMIKRGEEWLRTHPATACLDNRS